MRSIFTRKRNMAALSGVVAVAISVGVPAIPQADHPGDVRPNMVGTTAPTQIPPHRKVDPEPSYSATPVPVAGP